MNLYVVIALVFLPFQLLSQKDTANSKLSFEADFRFRIEQDWNSKKQDGTYRDDRTRLRYRVRAGAKFEDNAYTAGFRIRTGNPRKQQDPQLTLGESFEEFGTLPIGLEKAYFQGKWDVFEFWVGKNTFPFEKSNELFWSDNVFPEGVFFSKKFMFDSTFIDDLNFNAGHFIMRASGKSIDMDSYVQGYQIKACFFKKRLELFPSFYYFKNVPNIPDGGHTYLIDYAILHFGSKIRISKKPLLSFEYDFYYNIADFNKNDSIPLGFNNQNTGMVFGLKYGQLKDKGDWLFKASYARLQQYSIVDIMAQNDWARWDYSSNGSPDGRLTNYQGMELVAGYAFDERLRLKMKFYMVEQLIPYGASKENGTRIRLDLDYRF